MSAEKMPFPLRRAVFVDGKPSQPGMPYMITFVDRSVGSHDDPWCPVVNPETPWLLIVHELPGRGNMWRGYYASLETAVDDALFRRLVAPETAEQFLHPAKLPPQHSSAWYGLLPDPDFSLDGLQRINARPCDTWENVRLAMEGKSLAALPANVTKVC